MIHVEAKCNSSALQTTKNNIDTEITKINSDVGLATTARTNLRRTIGCKDNVNGKKKYFFLVTRHKFIFPQGRKDQDC